MSMKWKLVLGAVWQYLVEREESGGALATAGEVAEAFGVSRVTAWRWLKKMREVGAVDYAYGAGESGKPAPMYLAVRHGK